MYCKKWYRRRVFSRRIPLSLEQLEDRVTPSTVINVNDPSNGLDNPLNVTVGTLGNNVTLIDAINAANNTSATSGGSYVINLPAGNTITYTQPLNIDNLSSPNSIGFWLQDQNWYGPNALPAISSNITIQGNGDTLQVATNFLMRFFYVSGGPTLTGGALPEGTLELDNLTLEGGRAQGGNGINGGGGGLGAGGAIFNQGNLTLNGVTLTNNLALGGSAFFTAVGSFSGGGGMGSGPDNIRPEGGGFGGGFQNPFGASGGLGSSAGGGGGGAGFQSGDTGGGPSLFHGGVGGGLGAFGGLGGLRAGSQSGTSGDGGGGGTAPSAGGSSGGALGFGGLPAGSNVEAGGGGGVGGGGGSGLGGGGGGGFGGGGGYNDGGGGFGGGGGATVFLGEIGGNGGFGGGNGGTSSTSVGGGGAGMGGGIFNVFGTLTIINSTLSGNTAQGGNAGNGNGGVASGGSGYGGAIFNLDGNATLIYTTIANNSVLHGNSGSKATSTGDANGGGVYNLAYGNTVTGKANTATLTLNNSVIGQNENAGISRDLVNDAENGKNTNTAQVNGGFSVVQGGAYQLGKGSNIIVGGAITVTSASNLATTLANNGGLTETLAPNSGSPVLGAGNASLLGLPSVDQVGNSRPTSSAAIKPDDGAVQTQAVTSIKITTLSVNTTFNSTVAQTVTLSATVSDSNGNPVKEGSVTFTVVDTNLTTTAFVTNGTATAILTVPTGFPAGTGLAFSANYTDTSAAALYADSFSEMPGELTVNTATVTTTALTILAAIIHNQPVVTLAANVAGIHGTVNEGTVTFTLLNPNGNNLTAVADVTGGTATANVTLPANFPTGTYVYIAAYADSNNAASVPNFAAINGAATADPASGRVTLTQANPPVASGPAIPQAGSSPGTPPAAPVGSLSLFAIGLGPTGIDLFEVDSQGEVFAQSLFGGGLQLVSPSLDLLLALMSNDALLALLLGNNGQTYFIDVLNPFIPFVEPALLNASHG